jgi:hypothetical protein
MTSTVGNWRALVEGTPETRQAAFEEQRREARVLAARAQRGWREYRPDELTPRRHALRTLYVTPDGDVLVPVRTQVFAENLRENDMQVGCHVWNEGASCAFSVDEHNNVTVYEPGPFRSVVLLDLSEKQRQWKRDTVRMNERERDMEIAAFRKSQPVKQVTLADLERRELPGVQDAARLVLEMGGTMNVRDGRLEVGLPERLSPDPQEHNRLREDLVCAATVLFAAANIVVPAIESRSKKTLEERLPAAQVLAGGGLA